MQRYGNRTADPEIPNSSRANPIGLGKPKYLSHVLNNSATFPVTDRRHQRETEAPTGNFAIETYLDLVIIAARNEQRLLIMEAYSSHGTFVLFELFEQCAHTIVPQLDDATMQRGENPGPSRVETHPFDTGRLRLEFCKHLEGSARPRRAQFLHFSLRNRIPCQNPSHSLAVHFSAAVVAAPTNTHS